MEIRPTKDRIIRVRLRRRLYRENNAHKKVLTGIVHLTLRAMPLRVYGVVDRSARKVLQFKQRLRPSFVLSFMCLPKTEHYGGQLSLDAA